MKASKALLAVVVVCGAVIAVVILQRQHQQPKTVRLPHAEKFGSESSSLPIMSTNNSIAGTISLPVPATRTTVFAKPVLPSYPAPTWATVSTNIQQIAGQTITKGHNIRLAAIHTLPDDLNPQDINALYWFLHQPHSAQGDMDLLTFNALKNDILDALLRQKELPSDLGSEIIGMYRERGFDTVWHDYCVQHFAPYYEATKINAQEQKAILQAYDEALKEKDSSVAGSALIGLERLSQAHGEVSRDTVASLALSFAQDESCGVQTRITAIAIAGQMGKAEILPTARILAETGEPTSIRLAAVGAIGNVGTAADTELLQGILAGTDKAVHKAAETALKKIRMR